jgi:hypothetical protein
MICAAQLPIGELDTASGDATTLISGTRDGGATVSPTPFLILLAIWQCLSWHHHLSYQKRKHKQQGRLPIIFSSPANGGGMCDAGVAALPAVAGPR